MKRRSFLASICALFVPLPKKPKPLTVQQVATQLLRSLGVNNAEQISTLYGTGGAVHPMFGGHPVEWKVTTFTPKDGILVKS